MMSTAVDADTKTALATAANEARGLAMDSIAAAHSGHMGLPLGAAEIGAVLYGSQVRLCYPGRTRRSVLVFLSHFSTASFYLYR
jgi:transketolase N-terminal domain/subunit